MTRAPTLTREDLDVFSIDGFGPRMEAFKATLRPHLVAVGAHLAPSVSDIAGQALYVHVAKHARRTVNPPAESWAAFASRERGYKVLPHFALCVSRGGLHARLVLKDEATEARARLVRSLTPARVKALAPDLAKHGVRDYASWDAVTLPEVIDVKGAGIKAMAAHATLKTGSFSAGISLGKMYSEAAVLDAFRALLPLYSLAVAKAKK